MAVHSPVVGLFCQRGRILAIRWTYHKVIRLISVLSAALVFFSWALLARVPESVQHGLGLVFVIAMLIAILMPMVMYAVIVRAMRRSDRRWQMLDAGLTIAGWLCVWLVVMVAR